MEIPLVDDVVLGGRYRLGSLLGAGGMAQVFDGWDERLARAVAVKLLRPDLAALAELRRRFELEARAAARLTHPNVVAVFDAGDDHGRSYIVMERLRGESLADSIGRGPVDLTWLRRMASEVLAALGAAHDAGIIHRDIKPGNILLGPDGQAKVADFGIARVAETRATTDMVAGDTATGLTGAGLVLGTPAYLAPERAIGQPATPQSDLYSLGVVLYEALTGRKPFAGATPVAIAAAALQGAAQDPSLLRPGADPRLVAVITRSMALDPAQRYTTAAEMAADLRRPPPPATAVMPALPPLVAGAGGDVGSGGTEKASLVGAGAGSGLAATLPVGPGQSMRPGLAPEATPTARPAASRGGRRPPPRSQHRWALTTLAAAAVAVIVLVVIAANPGSGSRAAPAAPTATSPAAQPSPPTGATSAPSVSTAPSVVASNQSDSIGAALSAIATHLLRSKSAAAGQLAAGLSSVAATAGPAARAAAAASLLERAVQWFQQGQLSRSDYVVAAAVLNSAGAPQAPPPTVKKQGGNSGGGGGGGD